ncbi:MAG TPA: SH3 domain-containing protein [Spirillospora sp.]|nr:SH3 domain-containing protein [Spirillospora sp.]
MSRSILIVILTVVLALVISGAASASDAEATTVCSQPTRLTVGSVGRVTTYPSLPNRLRAQPSFFGQIIASIPAGGQFSILNGPHCESGLLWWQVNYSGLIGWTAEGNGYNTYYLEPTYAPPPPPPPACVLTPRLIVGGLGRVMPVPAIPNVVRTAPGTSSTGANSVVIGEIPPGGVFSVLAGPNCGTDGRWWWQVNYNGLVGWTAEGEGYHNYWLEPWQHSGAACPGFLPSRLIVGGLGAVTSVPSLPNRMRSGPAFNFDSIGLIPVNGVFTVLNGPYCNNNTAWWQVNYNGLVGWTAEGQASTYWLRPA